MKYAIAVIVLVLAALTVKLGALWWSQHQWFDLQARQLATIKRIGTFRHPDGNLTHGGTPLSRHTMSGET